jgi:predicted nucleotidyltransferase
MTRPYNLDSGARARITEQLAAELASVHDIAFAYVYGSFMESGPFHDVDVGVYLRVPQPQGTVSFAVALAQRLSEKAGLPVDVRVLNAAPVSFLFHVLRGRLLLNRDDDLLTDLMERTASRYLDMAPLLRHSTKEAFA